MWGAFCAPADAAESRDDASTPAAAKKTSVGSVKDLADCTPLPKEITQEYSKITGVSGAVRAVAGENQTLVW